MTKNSRKSQVNRLFSAPIDAETLLKKSAGTRPKKPGSTGPIRAMSGSLMEVEEANEKMKEMIAAGVAIYLLDPSDIDPSPVPDRFRFTDEEAFESLKKSIDEGGVQTPITVRPHPDQPDRYQTVYGNRRRTACEQLGSKVPALVKPMSHEEMLVAQGQENSERQDLTFLEVLCWVWKLWEKENIPRNTIARAIGNKSEATVSTYMSLARLLPDTEVLEWIGNARGVGRPRWEEFAALWDHDLVKEAIRKEISNATQEDYNELGTEGRFTHLLDIAIDVPKQENRQKRTKRQVVRSKFGPASEVLLKETATKMSFEIDLKKQPKFAAFIRENLESYIQKFREEEEMEKQ
ncbi:plasmid partitioning protein RepB [Pseudovibrio sp. Ad37]|uniref:plasmid partitioning protein RepB n=1 Tax=Pseudovibrio sp. Ad37 TaxID=989422 RepID=UPI0007AEBAF9|nr:plasmid partitioning protein RepB [Pseudovibrio sp. Ad37]KZL24232.1 putative chromosome-partitioning protein ParB [Pseudovibrio sp. Ad37]